MVQVLLDTIYVNEELKKGWKVHSLSKNKPKKNRKIKGVKYILCNIENRKLLKKLNNYYDYIINSVGYVDHSKNKKDYDHTF